MAEPLTKEERELYALCAEQEYAHPDSGYDEGDYYPWLEKYLRLNATAAALETEVARLGHELEGAGEEIRYQSKLKQEANAEVARLTLRAASGEARVMGMVVPSAADRPPPATPPPGPPPKRNALADALAALQAAKGE